MMIIWSTRMKNITAPCDCALPPVVGVSARRGEPLRALQELRSDGFTPTWSRSVRAGHDRGDIQPFSFLPPVYFGVFFPPLFSRGVMSARRAGVVLLCALLALARARRSSPEPDDVQEKINSARCTSRCLSLHMTQLAAAFRHIQVPRRS